MTDSPLTDVVAGNIRALLAKTRINKKELSKRCGIPYSSLVAKLNGHRVILLKDIERISIALGVDNSALLTLDANDHRHA